MFRSVALFTLLLLAPCGSPASGLEPMDDRALAGVQARGVAIGFDDFQFAMAPTSYMEQVGVAPDTPCTSGGSGTGNQDCWRRGDLRWYAGNLSGAGPAGSHWNEGVCDGSGGPLSCPRGGVIDHFSPYDNPYLIRAWSPVGMGYDGSCINGTDGYCSGSPTVKSIYEFRAPSAQPWYTFSFWGEIESGRVPDPLDPWNQQLGSRYGLLKSQTLIRGNAAGSVFQAFQFTDPSDQTLSFLYHSRLQGDFRFSVAQSATGATDQVGAPPVFDPLEGLHFRNVDAYIPFGQLYYQAITIGAVGTNGGFFIEMPRLPNQSEVFNKFYGLRAGDTLGYETARLALQGDATDAYRLSHGYSRWGDWYPGSAGTRNGRTDTGDGIFFRACSSCSDIVAFAKRPIRIDVRGETYSMQRTQNYTADGSDGPGPIYGGPGSGQTLNSRVVNLGDSRIEGMAIQNFRLTTCSAGPGIC